MYSFSQLQGGSRHSKLGIHKPLRSDQFLHFNKDGRILICFDFQEAYEIHPVMCSAIKKYFMNYILRNINIKSEVHDLY